ncbi:orotate phosphoribosyltransferase [Phytohabitans kaempferiae]|uniref:Orotate phosphoribosyltransferase n=1 Tax=Phytohabitans kaempferiae TaxID=1620943 RepID=A0ABV6MAA7_9ACTN
MLGQLQYTLRKQDDAGHRRELAHDLLAAGAGIEDGQPDWYLHTASFLTRPSILRRLASELAALVEPDVDRLAGRASPLLAAVALATGLPFATLHPGAGSDGYSIVDGEIHTDERVLVIEDVVLSGNTARDTANAIRAVGARVDTVVCALDLGRGGAKVVAAGGYRLRPVLTADDLRPLRPVDGTVDDDLAMAGFAGNGQAPRFDLLADTRCTHRLGRALGDLLRHRELSHLLVWERPDDVVLGFVLAAELGLPVVRLESVSGLLYLSGTFPPSARVAVVACAFESPGELVPLSALLAQTGTTLAAVAGLVRTPAVTAEIAGTADAVFLHEGEAAR